MAERMGIYSRECMRDFLSTFSSGMRRQMVKDVELAREQIALELEDKPQPAVEVMLRQQDAILHMGLEDLNIAESEWQRINAQKA